MSHHDKPTKMKIVHKLDQNEIVSVNELQRATPAIFDKVKSPRSRPNLKQEKSTFKSLTVL